MQDNEKPRYVSFEVAPKPAEGYQSMFDEDAFPTTNTVADFRPDQQTTVRLARTLQRYDIDVYHIGDYSISARATTLRFERMFRTEVSAIERPEESATPEGTVYFAPAEGAPWELPTRGGLDQMIDRTHIQHEPIYFANERPLPPFWNDKFRLRVHGDVTQLMAAAEPHRDDTDGTGVRGAMTDTGFYAHPYFANNGYQMLAVTAPDTSDHTSDDHLRSQLQAPEHHSPGTPHGRGVASGVGNLLGEAHSE